MKIFEAWDMLAIEGIMRPGDVYVEIGAHRGRFFRESGVVMLNNNGPACHYHLYEPSTDARKELEEVADAARRMMSCCPVHIYPEAIWTHDLGTVYYADRS